MHFIFSFGWSPFDVFVREHSYKISPHKAFVSEENHACRSGWTTIYINLKHVYGGLTHAVGKY